VEVLFGALLLAVVAAFVLAPLLRGDGADGAEDPRVADLEARKEAKYREIRDAELDHAAGKISDGDFERLDAELRGDAVGILDRLRELRGEDTEQPPQNP
jgi:hypothetical protein